MNRSKVLSLLLCIAMCMSICASFAAGDEVATFSGDDAVSDIEITSDVPLFSVTVPTALTAHVDESGDVTCASPDQTLIINESYGPVYVSDISAEAVGSWSIMAYDANYDISDAKPDSHVVGFKINDVTSKADGTLAGYDASDWGMSGVGDSVNNHIEIDYDIKLPIQYTQLDDTVVVQVVFTVAWDTVNT